MLRERTGLEGGFEQLFEYLRARLPPVPTGARSPALVGTAIDARFAAGPPPEYALEIQAIANAVASRRAEFTAGRHCAREALRCTGVSAVELPKTRTGSPQWPDGRVGSITHDGQVAIAIVADIGHLGSIGIDVERRQTLSPDVVGEIGTADEYGLCERAGLLHDAPVMLFSIKESVYKCIGRRMRRMPEFLDVRMVEAVEIGRVDGVRQVVVRVWIPGTILMTTVDAIVEGLMVVGADQVLSVSWELPPIDSRTR